MRSVVVIEPPEPKPLTLEEVKRHVRVTDHSDDDGYLEGLIDAATAYLDGPAGVLGRALITQTLELRLDAFCGDIALRCAPVQDEPISIKYDDTDGAEQSLDSSVYRLVGSAISPRLVLTYGSSWPSARYQSEAVRVRYVAGYGDAPDDVPAAIRHAMLLMIGTWYAQRENVVVGQTVAQLPAAADALLMPYRIF